MSRKAETVTIDGEKYVIGILEPKQALRILTRLLKLLGEPLTAFVSNIDPKDPGKSLLDNNLSPEVLSNAVRGLVTRLDEDEVVSTIEELIGVVIVGGKGKASLEAHFLGRIGHLLKVVVAVMKVNYSDFFGVIPGIKDLRASQGMSPEI